jgi:hypothetical protein
VPIPLGIAIVAACVIGFYYLANRALYYPLKYPKGDWEAQHLIGASDVWMDTSDGVKIHGWWLKGDGARWASHDAHSGNHCCRFFRSHAGLSQLWQE